MPLLTYLTFDVRDEKQSRYAKTQLITLNLGKDIVKTKRDQKTLGIILVSNKTREIPSNGGT